MSAVIRRIAERDPSDADMLAAVAGLGRTEGVYMELGKDRLALFYDESYPTEDDAIRGAWVVTPDGLHKRPYSTFQEALMVALRETKALL